MGQQEKEHELFTPVDDEVRDLFLKLKQEEGSNDEAAIRTGIHRDQYRKYCGDPRRRSTPKYISLKNFDKLVIALGSPQIVNLRTWKTQYEIRRAN